MTSSAPDDHALILETEERRRKAAIACDIAGLDAVLADDLLHVHSSGRVDDKATLLEHVATRRPYVSIERGTLTVRVYGDAAVLTGPMTNLMRQPDESTIVLEGFVTQVLRRQAGQWRFVSFQMTRV